MSNNESSSLYSCWQNLFHIIRKNDETINQENDANVNRSKEDLVQRDKFKDETISRTNHDSVDKICQTDDFQDYNIETIYDNSGKKEEVCTNSLNKDENFKILRKDYAVYSNSNLNKSRKIESDNFNKGDFRKHFKYPKVYALYKTVSGLRIGLHKKCKKSSKYHNNSDIKCYCPHCGAMDVVNESLKHPVTFDYDIDQNTNMPSNSIPKENVNKKHVRKIDGLSKHPSFVNLVTQLKAMEKRIAQLEHETETLKFNMHTKYSMSHVKNERYARKTNDGIMPEIEYEKRYGYRKDIHPLNQLAKGFPMAFHKLRSEKYRQMKEQALNVHPEESSTSLSQKKISKTQVRNETENSIKKSKRTFLCKHNYNENESKHSTHSILQNDMIKGKYPANSLKVEITDLKQFDTEKIKKNIPKRDNTNPNRDNSNPNRENTNYEHGEEETEFNKTFIAHTGNVGHKNSTVSIISDSKSCWSNFKCMFSQVNKPNDKTRTATNTESKRPLSEINCDKSEKRVPEKFRNCEKHSYENSIYQTYNVASKNINVECADCSNLEINTECNLSKSSTTVNTGKVHSYTSINYKELLKSTPVHRTELNNILTLSPEGKSQLLMEKFEHLEDINKKIEMIQRYYGEIK